MRRFVMASALAIVLAAGSALASDDAVRVEAPKDQWLTIPQISEKLASQGYEVRRVKTEKGGYEVYVKDKDGKRFEAYVHPVTGEILKQEGDDD